MKNLKIVAIATWVCFALIGCESSKNIEVKGSQNPLRIIVLNDKSHSMNDDTLSLYDLEVLIDSVALRGGGQFVYSEITAAMTPTIYTMQIPLPPQMPKKFNDKNPFKIDVASKKAAEIKLKLNMEAYIRNRDVLYAQYANSIEPILRDSKRSNFSDITAALEKIQDLICMQTAYPYETRIIIHSDMADDIVGGGNLRTFEEFKCSLGTPIIIIGATDSGNVGLKSGTYINMGSMQEAINYIFNQNN
jgi:hypothetical protein